MTETSTCALVDLSPVELADLLGLPAQDAPYLATAPIRLPRAWVETWQTKTGVRELTVPDLCLLLSCTARTIFRHLAPDASPRLCSRVGVLKGSRKGRVVSPANLVNFLRDQCRVAGLAPKVGETAGQKSNRVKAAQQRIAQLCGD